MELLLDTNSHASYGSPYDHLSSSQEWKRSKIVINKYRLLQKSLRLTGFLKYQDNKVINCSKDIEFFHTKPHINELLSYSSCKEWERLINTLVSLTFFVLLKQQVGDTFVFTGITTGVWKQPRDKKRKCKL